MISANTDLETKIVDAIYRGACDAEELARAVELIRQYFGSPGVALGNVDQLRPECEAFLGTGVIDAQSLAEYADYAPMDPIPRAFSALPVGGIGTSRRLVPDEDRPPAFMHDYLHRRGVVETVGGPVLRADGSFAAISVLEGAGQEAFGDDEIARLTRLVPHLTRALQIRRLFIASEQRRLTLESIVDRSETGMIVLHQDGTGLLVNAAARRIGAERDGLALDRDGRPVAAERGAAKRLAALQADVTRGGAGGLARVARTSARAPYVVLVAPLPPNSALAAQRGVLFAIHDPARKAIHTDALLAQALQVPLASAQLIHAILEGVDLKDYAERAAISMNTVRYHLKMAFARTGARNQVELVRQALRAVNDLAPFVSIRK